MKKLVLAMAVLSMALIVGCAKKDEGGGGAPGCPPAQVAAPAFATCLPQAQCPVGLAQSPSENSMCVDIRTGQNVMPQQCGAGFYLTISGCMPKGECQGNRALRGDVCIEIINAGSGGYGGQQSIYGQGGYGQGGYGQPGIYGGQQGVYGQPGVGFGQTINPYFR